MNTSNLQADSEKIEIDFEKIDVFNDVARVEHVDFISADSYTKFIQDVKTSVMKLAGEHNLNLIQMQSNKTAFDIAFDLKVSPVETVSMDMHGRNYLAHGMQFNLKPEWYSRVIVANIKGQECSLKLTGLCEIDKHVLVRFSTNLGIRYMNPARVVELMLQENRKTAYSSMTVQLISAGIQRKSLHDKLFGKKRMVNLVGTESPLTQTNQLKLASSE